MVSGELDMGLKLLGFLLGAALSSNAAAQEWWWVGNAGAAPDQYNRYIDRSAVERPGPGIRRAWDFIHTQRPRAGGVRLVKTLQIYDCKKRTIRSLSVTNYDEAGNVLDAGTLTGPAQAVVPKSSGESL